MGQRERLKDAMQLALKTEGHDFEECRWPRKPEKARQWLFPYGLWKERGPAEPSGCLTYRTVRQMCVVLSHCVCGDLFQKKQETNTGAKKPALMNR